MGSDRGLRAGAERVAARMARFRAVCEELTLPLSDGARYPMVSQIAEIGEGAVAGCIRPDAVDLARRLSQKLPGQVWRGTGGVCWNLGGQMVYLMDWGRVAGILEARRAVVALGVPSASWSLSGLARHALKWIGPPQRHWACSEAKLKETPHAYRLCRPGVHRAGTLFDLERAYHAALKHLPSFRCTWLADGPIWHPMEAGEYARWQALLHAVGECKPLRTIVHGCLCGSRKETDCYVGGVRHWMRRGYGPYRTAGLATVRAIYELTWLAARETSAWYANTDCVLGPTGRSPRIWERYGYPYRVAAEGHTEVRCIDTYRVGSKMTAYYRADSRYSRVFDTCPEPSELTFLEWH